MHGAMKKQQRLDEDDEELEADKLSGRVSRKDMSTRAIDFLQDNPSEMTYSRRVALHLMKRYKWYNPQLNEISTDYNELDGVQTAGSFNKSVLYSSAQLARPSLEKAWAYFDHVTLPRHLYQRKDAISEPTDLLSQTQREAARMIDGDDEQLDLAEPGENRYQTKLYSPFFTPLNQMGDFGVGVGLYFTTLRSITVLMLVAGLINIPNLIYFSSKNYSANKEGLPFVLKGSAICTQKQWVPCPKCTAEDFPNAAYRIAETSDYYNSDLMFAAKNNCDGATLAQGMVNYGTLFFVVLGVGVMNRYQKKKEVDFDEDEQTAQDYSIVIHNPPPDATDPEEWRAFFTEQFVNIHVTCCTVALDNYLLVRALVQRRELLQQLKLMLPQGTPIDAPNWMEIAADAKAERNRFSHIMAHFVPDVPELCSKLIAVNDRIQQLSSIHYPAACIFLTFETEAAQRQVLSALSVGRYTKWRNATQEIKNQNHLFRSMLVLDAKQADEPSTIRWQDLGERFKDRVVFLMMTTYVWAGAVVLVAFIVRFIRDKNSVFAAFAISGFNVAFPVFAKMLANFESHASESKRQTSIYIKIAVFRFVNTAIVITMITPFTATLSDVSNNLLGGVYAIFFADIVTTNVIQLADPVGFFQRHYLAPRAETQEAMNKLMQGQEYDLAERYTNMTKILFLSLWYCSIFPGAFYLCALATYINYYADRFSLMRTWEQAPRLASGISKFGRRYFFSMAILVMAIASSYAWTGFPYDNLCKNDYTDMDDNYEGTWTIITLDGSTSTEVTVSAGDPSYRYCSQDFLRYGSKLHFPALPRFQPQGDEWMTDEQEILTSIYGWTTLIVVAGLCLMFLLRFLRYVQTRFRGSYMAVGDDQGINFSDVPQISSYIPQVKSSFFSYPLLAVDTDDVDEELYEWKDPDKAYSFYSLTRDVDEVLKGQLVFDYMKKNLFSRVKYWPPKQHTEPPGHQRADLC